MHLSVHPSIIGRFESERAAACGQRLGCGGGATQESSGRPSFEADDSAGAEYGARHEGGVFGVRRPLRFLAYRLGLSDAQVAEMARILDELKTERAQAAVDDRRTLTAFADALGKDAFDEALARRGADLRRSGGDRLAEAVVKALGRIHAILEAEQRDRLAYMIRTGALTL